MLIEVRSPNLRHDGIATHANPRYTKTITMKKK